MKKICIILSVVFVFSNISVYANSVTRGVMINGNFHDITPIYLDNEKYLQTDSWYFPMREIFEKLGCQVNWDVDKEVIDDSDVLQMFPQYEWRKSFVTDEITEQLYGATVNFNKNMPIIEIKGVNDRTVYCQLGSEAYFPFAGGPPPVLIYGKTYVSVCLIDYVVSTLYDDVLSSVYWDSQIKDRQYSGAVTWDFENEYLIIDTNISYVQNYVDKIEEMNSSGKRVLQRKENNEYVFCLVNDMIDENEQAFLAINKKNGTIHELDKLDRSLSNLIYIVLHEDKNNFASLYKTVSHDGEPIKLVLHGEYQITK